MQELWMVPPSIERKPGLIILQYTSPVVPTRYQLPICLLINYNRYKRKRSAPFFLNAALIETILEQQCLAQRHAVGCPTDICTMNKASNRS